MTDDLITIRLKLTGGTAAAAEAKAVSAEIAGTGKAASTAGLASSRASAGLKRFRTGLIAMGRAAKTGAVIGVAALSYELFRSVSAFRESRAVSRQTQAVIKSTGGAAKVTAKDVANLSGALSLKTGVDDEVIQSGANMLLTFKNIRNEVGKGNDIFNQGVASVNDLAAAMESTPKAAAIQLGKALNDPILGMASLGRVGIQFTEQQKEQITGFVESNDLLSAQKLILGEVTSQFKGSARARSDSVDRLSVAFENLQEKIGKALFPTITKVARFLTGFFTDIIKGKGAAEGFGTAMGKVGPVISDVSDWVTEAVTKVKAFVDELLHGSGDIGKFGRDVKSIALAVKDVLVKTFELAKGPIAQFFSGMKQGIGGVLKVIGGFVKIVGGILKGDWSRVWEGAKDIVSGAISALVGAIKGATAPIRFAFNVIKEIVGTVLGWIGDKIAWVIDKITWASDKLDALLGRQHMLTGQAGEAAGLAGDAFSQINLPTGGGGGGGGGNQPPAGGHAQDKLPQLTPRTAMKQAAQRVTHIHNHIYIGRDKVAHQVLKAAEAAAARA